MSVLQKNNLRKNEVKIMTNYTNAGLQGRDFAEVKQIAKGFNIPIKGKKTDIVEKILEAQEKVNNEENKAPEPVEQNTKEQDTKKPKFEKGASLKVSQSLEKALATADSRLNTIAKPSSPTTIMVRTGTNHIGYITSRKTGIGYNVYISEEVADRLGINYTDVHYTLRANVREYTATMNEAQMVEFMLLVQKTHYIIKEEKKAEKERIKAEKKAQKEAEKAQRKAEKENNKAIA